MRHNKWNKGTKLRNISDQTNLTRMLLYVPDQALKQVHRRKERNLLFLRLRHSFPPKTSPWFWCSGIPVAATSTDRRFCRIWQRGNFFDTREHCIGKLISTAPETWKRGTWQTTSSRPSWSWRRRQSWAWQWCRWSSLGNLSGPDSTGFPIVAIVEDKNLSAIKYNFYGNRLSIKPERFTTSNNVSFIS